MQLKFNDRKINVLDGKITGITSNSVDDINYFFDNNLSKKIYKISLNNIDYSCNMSVKDYLLNYYKIDELLKLLNLSSKIINREVNTLSFSEKVRIEIYRMYVILKMIVDCELKQYGRFDWMYENLDSRISSLQRVKK